MCVVERPGIPPNWSLSNLSLMLSISHFPITLSRCLQSVAVREIGRKSDDICFGGFVFGTGHTLACFQMVGTWPSRTEVLKILHTGRDMCDTRSLSIQFGISSGPGDLLIFVSIRCFSTSSTDMM